MHTLPRGDRICILSWAALVDQHDLDRITALLCQLSQSRKQPINRDRVSEVAKGSSIILYKRDDEIIGTATLVQIRLLSRNVGFVEDVVVDQNHRGRGIGTHLMRYLLRHAQYLDLERIYLTSRPSRKEANGLYKKLGFEKRRTNFYRFSFL